MIIRQFIVTDRVILKLNLVLSTYTFKIDGRLYNADSDEPFNNQRKMLAHAIEQILRVCSEIFSEDEYEAIIAALDQIQL